MPDADGFTPQRTISLRLGIVLVGDRRHLAVERHVRRAGRRRAHRAREPRRAEAPPELRVEVVLRQQAVRSAVGVRQDRRAAVRRPSPARIAIGDELERFVPRHALELPVALAALADRRIEQAIRPVDALAELPHLRADVAVGDRVLVRAVDRRRPCRCCTVTARLHASGQSSGHAVSTTDDRTAERGFADGPIEFAMARTCGLR